MLQSIIEVSLQGSNVVADLDTVETDPRVAPLHPHPVTTEDEIVVDALLAQPMSKANISRLENIYRAIEFVPFDAMKVRLEIRKWLTLLWHLNF